jgi:OOP family OmpA-OmpF porin
MLTKKMIMLIGLVTFMLPWVPAENAYCLEEVVQQETVVTVFKETDIVTVADNVVVLFDSSSSMADPYKDTGMQKIQAEKQLLKQRVEKMPDISLNVGLYSFSKKLETYYEMQPVNKEKLLAAIDNLPEKAGGPTMMQNTLRNIEPILQGVSGRTVVFLFSDGKFTSFEGTNQMSPVYYAKELAKKYDVSFYIISTASADREQQMLRAVSSINESSRVVPFSLLMDNPEYYTGAVFVVEESYIALAETTEKVIGFKLGDVLFDFDKSDIKTEFTDQLDKVGQMLKENPNSKVVLAGFTDSKGTPEYNLGLSHRRVEAVGQYLSQKYNVESDRIILLWYGELAPVASNETEEGRQKNRRVLGYVDIGN